MKTAKEKQQEDVAGDKQSYVHVWRSVAHNQDHQNPDQNWNTEVNVNTLNINENRSTIIGLSFGPNRVSAQLKSNL